MKKWHITLGLNIAVPRSKCETQIITNDKYLIIHPMLDVQSYN